MSTGPKTPPAYLMTNRPDYFDMLCPICNTVFESGACPTCSGPSVSTSPQSQNPYAAAPRTAPHTNQQPASQEMTGDATHGIIPYKNPKALTAYYLGIVSGLPFIGLPFGIAAFILGIMGLRDRKRNPVIKGSIHAGIGIGCGLIFTLLWTLISATLLFAYLSQP